MLFTKYDSHDYHLSDCWAKGILHIWRTWPISFSLTANLMAVSSSGFTLPALMIGCHLKQLHWDLETVTMRKKGKWTDCVQSIADSVDKSGHYKILSCLLYCKNYIQFENVLTRFFYLQQVEFVQKCGKMWGFSVRKCWSTDQKVVRSYPWFTKLPLLCPWERTLSCSII